MKAQIIDVLKRFLSGQPYKTDILKYEKAKSAIRISR
jgi:hypothetical protein